jgi:hypothetical protein
VIVRKSNIVAGNGDLSENQLIGEGSWLHLLHYELSALIVFTWQILGKERPTAEPFVATGVRGRWFRLGRLSEWIW